LGLSVPVWPRHIEEIRDHEMKSIGLNQMSDTELVSEFVAAAKARGLAVTELDSRCANVWFDRMKAVDQELRARGTAARMALGPLLDVPDRFVRYYAAIYLLALMPDEARTVLEWNAAYGADTLGADARGFLQAIDDGSYKPN
jgi:hypothetical protein